MYSVDKTTSRQRFNKAAHSYDAYADIQNQVLHSLCENLSVPGHGYQRILDLGSGTGNGACMLADLFADTHIIQLDFAFEMLKHSRLKSEHTNNGDHICADIDKLPFQANSFDMIFSSLTVQWSQDLPALLQIIKSLLKPGGQLIFSSLEEGSLQELHDSWLSVDTAEHVNRFHSLNLTQDHLHRAGFQKIDVQSKTMTCYYPDATSLLTALKGLGVTNSLAGQRKSLTGKARFQSFLKNLSDKQGAAGIPLSYKLILASAQAGVVEKS